MSWLKQWLKDRAAIRNRRAFQSGYNWAKDYLHNHPNEVDFVKAFTNGAYNSSEEHHAFDAGALVVVARHEAKEQP